jgi:two-component system, OmpR family, KDP operon response regulator KdpE
LNLLLSPPNQPSYRDERLHVDLRQQRVIFDSTKVTLTRVQYRVLALLVGHAGEVVPRAIILKRIWGDAPEIQVRTVDKHVNALRKKLGIYANQYIETVIGVGYRFRPAIPHRG